MPPVHMLFVGAWFLLGTGLYGLMIARNVLKAVIALQIMVKAAMLILVVAGAQTGQLALGQSLGITVIVADTMAVVIGLAMAVRLNASVGTLELDDIIEAEG
ncbi:MAG: NADH-quinone oxidoreductase subunit K [Anaerolineae bacterium]|nr:NADH-quinone oxidoreductase subunit K [Anaerolineae bacterium]MCA9888977.1 NADH-quinone oxidoreductase subunit K [Anaerolineae bacterium]MCB9461015.1 NADH-quinone oxidoreductase subunit K [Anaerolineaceae bacterium]